MDYEGNQTGYCARFLFTPGSLCVDSPEQSIQRIHERVAQGGHDVADEDVRRRYARSLSNLKQIIRITNETLIYDNAGAEPTLILETRTGTVIRQATGLPPWACDLLDAIRP